MARRSHETANSILAAARELGLAESAFHQLPGARALALLDRVFDTFTKEGRGGRNRHWIWNDLRDPCVFLRGSREVETLLVLGTSSAPVWLIVEDFGEAKHVPYWVFEATLSAAVATLKNHHLLEFYVVSRDLSWLAGENHHDVWFAAGDHAVIALQATAR